MTSGYRDICMKVNPQSIWIHCRGPIIFPPPHNFLSGLARGTYKMFSHGYNEQTFSQRCWPEPGAYFAMIVLYTSRQSQVLGTTSCRVLFRSRQTHTQHTTHRHWRIWILGWRRASSGQQKCLANGQIYFSQNCPWSGLFRSWINYLYVNVIYEKRESLGGKYYRTPLAPGLWLKVISFS